MSFLCGDFNFAPSPSQVNFGSNFYGDWGCCGYRVPGGVATFVYLIIFLCECMISLPVCSMLTTKWKVPIFEAKVCIFGTWRCQSYLKLGQYALNRYGPNIWGVWPYGDVFDDPGGYLSVFAIFSQWAPILGKSEVFTLDANLWWHPLPKLVQKMNQKIFWLKKFSFFGEK